MGGDEEVDSFFTSMFSFKTSIFGESVLLSERQSLSSSSLSFDSFNKSRDCNVSSVGFVLEEVEAESPKRLAASSSLLVFRHLARRFLNQT